MVNENIDFNRKQSELLSNELQIIEFVIDGHFYGINLIKIKEIIIAKEVNKMPHLSKNIEGIFKSRDEIIMVIDLPLYLGLNKSEKINKDIFIITNFSNFNVAFRTHSIVGIKSLYWHEIKKTEIDDDLLIGIYTYDDKIVSILDFEKVLFDVSPNSRIALNGYDVDGHLEDKTEKIIIAEDSIVLSSAIKEVLLNCGYKNLYMFKDGQDAWDHLCELKNSSIDDVLCVITDIEMSKMDGHKLTSLIRKDEIYNDLPVIIFSSLISDNIYQMGEALNVYAQITKPNIDKIVHLLDELREKRNK